MGVESKIRELMEGAANRPKDKLTARDDSNPTQGDSNANPEMQDLSGTGNAEGGLTSPVGKAASGKASKDGTLPAGNGAKEAPANYVNDKPTESEVMKKASAGNVAKEEAEFEEDEVLAEDEIVEEDVEEITEEEVEEIEEEEVAFDDDVLYEEDLAALFEGDENLTEEFKVKAAEIFEAVVTSRVANEVEAIEAELEEQANVEFENKLEEMVENIDKYLNYVTENWMKENELAVENGLRNEITESFIKGMQQVFTEHYIEVPEEKYDVMTEMQNKIDELTEKLDEQVQKNIDLNEEAVTLKKQNIFAEIAEELADTDAEKFAVMVEDISYTSAESYANKLKVVKENYFRKEIAESNDTLEDSVDEISLTENTVMSRYASAISKSKKF
jgi:hypothetical protein